MSLDIPIYNAWVKIKTRKTNEMKFQFSIITLIAPNIGNINEAKHKRKCSVTALSRWRH